MKNLITATAKTLSRPFASASVINNAQAEFDDIGEVFTTAVQRYQSHAKKSLEQADVLETKAETLEMELQAIRDNKAKMQKLADNSKFRAARIDSLFIGVEAGDA